MHGCKIKLQSNRLMWLPLSRWALGQKFCWFLGEKCYRHIRPFHNLLWFSAEWHYRITLESVLSICPDFPTNMKFFRNILVLFTFFNKINLRSISWVLNIFPSFARKKAGSWILGSRFFPTMASVRLLNFFAQFLQPAFEATNWTLCVNRSSKVRGKTSLAW